MAYFDDVAVPGPTGPPGYDDMQWHGRCRQPVPQGAPPAAEACPVDPACEGFDADDDPAAGPRLTADEPDFYGPSRPPDPTAAPPGSWDKVEEMARRYGRREELFAPGDAPELPRAGFLSSKRTPSKRVARCVETAAGPKVVSRRPKAAKRHRRPSEVGPRTPDQLAADAARKRDERREARDCA